jgi:hypothetical protein
MSKIRTLAFTSVLAAALGALALVAAPEFSRWSEKNRQAAIQAELSAKRDELHEVLAKCIDEMASDVALETIAASTMAWGITEPMLSSEFGSDPCIIYERYRTECWSDKKAGVIYLVYPPNSLHKRNALNVVETLAYSCSTTLRHFVKQEDFYLGPGFEETAHDRAGSNLGEGFLKFLSDEPRYKKVHDKLFDQTAPILRKAEAAREARKVQEEKSARDEWERENGWMKR